MKNILILFPLAFSFLCVGCSSNDNPDKKLGSYVKKKLLATTPSFSDVGVIFPEFGIEWKTICLLRPYQENIPTNYQAASKINSYLKTVEFSADESNFALIFVNDTDIKIARIKRGSDLDVENYDAKKNHKTYRQVICSTRSNAIFVLEKNDSIQYFDILEKK